LKYVPLTSAVVLTDVGMVCQTLYHKPYGNQTSVWLQPNGLPDALERLDWYALPWKVETFHKAPESGCQVEQSRLSAAGRLTTFLAAIRIFELRFCPSRWSADSHVAETGCDVKMRANPASCRTTRLGRSFGASGLGG
jgi:hypothetical protein